MKLYQFRTLEPLPNSILRHAVPNNELTIILLVINKTVLITSSPCLVIKGFSRMVLILPLQIFDLFFLGFFLNFSIFLNFLGISLEQYFGRLLQILVPYLLAVVPFLFRWNLPKHFYGVNAQEKFVELPSEVWFFLGSVFSSVFWENSSMNIRECNNLTHYSVFFHWN